MSIEGLVNIKKAISTLNPKQVREMAERRVTIGLHAAGPESYNQMENFLLADLSPSRRRESAAALARSPGQILGQPNAEINIYHENVIAPAKALIYSPERPALVVNKTLNLYPDLGVTLASSFVPFRRPFIEKVITKTARENTLFSLATALPDIIPSFIELPWALAEFASDTAFLTMNQIRMAFVLAAASDREVGYFEQKSEIAAVIGSAFGWRALARQLIGKIPFGGGLIAKAGVAYAGTKVLGLSLDRYYSIGFTYSREERDQLYTQAFRQGRQIALKILGLVRPDLADRLAAQEKTKFSSRPRTAS